MFPLQLSQTMKVLLLAPVFALVAIGLVNGEWEGSVCATAETVDFAIEDCAHSSDIPTDPDQVPVN